MTDNEKIAKFMWPKLIKCDCVIRNCQKYWTGGDSEGGKGWIDHLPDFTGSDAAAIALLPVLVERGYSVLLEDDKGGWLASIRKVCADIEEETTQPTIAQAITTAVTALIDKEAKQ